VFGQEPDPTPFDLNWRMFGVAIRVHPLFWVLAAFLGWDSFFNNGGFGLLLLWVGCVFVSILLHEFGHVVAGRLFGSQGHILLYWFGGLAYGSSDLRKRWQRVVVFLAGPAAQLLLYAAIRLLGRPVVLLMPDSLKLPMLEMLKMLSWINFFWACFNLLPVFPLDGGRVTREICEAIFPARGGVYALGISTLVCAAAALYILLSSAGKVPDYLGTSMYNAMLFAMLGASSFQALQVEQARRNWDDRLPWER
jgi:Zn-dependent protease